MYIYIHIYTYMFIYIYVFVYISSWDFVMAGRVHEFYANFNRSNPPVSNHETSDLSSKKDDGFTTCITRSHTTMFIRCIYCMNLTIKLVLKFFFEGTSNALKVYIYLGTNPSRVDINSLTLLLIKTTKDRNYIARTPLERCHIKLFFNGSY